MKIDQDLVDRIVERARNSMYGLGEPHTSLSIKSYEPKDFESLALCLVSGFHEKYDLVSIFTAAFEEILDKHD